MIEKKHRIPQMAAAALLLGGPACGDSDGGGTPGGSTGGVNVSTSRIESIGKAFCSLYKQCAPSDFQDEYTSVGECTQAQLDDFDPGDSQLSADEKKCLDAYLDYYACISDVSCSDIENELVESKCSKFYDAVTDLCPDSYDYSYSGASGKRARRMRIPKP